MPTVILEESARSLSQRLSTGRKQLAGPYDRSEAPAEAADAPRGVAQAVACAEVEVETAMPALDYALPGQW